MNVHLVHGLTRSYFTRKVTGYFDHTDRPWRWSFPDNTVTAGWQISEELSAAIGLPGSFVRPNVVQTMTASLPRLGVTPKNIDAWMGEVLVGWLQALQPHLDRHDHLLGGRPCLADFAIFGANVAHFVGDPYCRDIVDEHGPSVVAHTHRLMRPQHQELGDWLDLDTLAETLLPVVAQAARHYLPWVAAATIDGAATVEFGAGVTAEIESSPFLDDARGVMLARYVAARSDRLDDFLDRAGVLAYFADYVDQATAVPDVAAAARPIQNRPYAVN